MKSIFTFVLTAVLCSGMFLVSGCNKKKDTIAKIYVRNASNDLVSGCEVTLRGMPAPGKQSNVSVTTETNASGEAIFNFNDLYKPGQAGVAILKIEANKNGSSATGIIKIEEEVTSDETVYLFP